MSLPSINFLHLIVSKMQPGQDFKGQGHYGEAKVQINSHHDIAHLESPINGLSSVNFLHITFSEIFPGQDFIGKGQYGKVKHQIKVTP